MCNWNLVDWRRANNIHLCRWAANIVWFFRRVVSSLGLARDILQILKARNLCYCLELTQPFDSFKCHPGARTVQPLMIRVLCIPGAKYQVGGCHSVGCFLLVDTTWGMAKKAASPHRGKPPISESVCFVALIIVLVNRIVDSLREYGAKIASVTCGKKHTLVLSADGEVLSCGAGEYGRLGTGSTSDSSIFESISALAEEDVVQVQAGASHSLALTAEGVVYSWGRNDRGQLGMRDSNMDIYSTEAYPRAIDDTLNSKPEHRAVQIAAGEDRSAYVTADGRLYVWGARLTHFPQLVDPSLFNGLRVRKCIIAGQASASIFAVLTEDHQLWTFGDRNSGLLGVPKPKSAIGVNITKQSTPAPVSAFVGKQVVDVFGGLGTHMAARVVLV